MGPSPPPEPPSPAFCPPASRFSRANDHGRKKQSARFRDRLAAFFDRYAGLTSS